MATISVLNTTSDLSGKTLVTAEGDRTLTGLLSFSRGGGAPFAVNVGAALVSNLDADKLDGLDGSLYTRNDGGANTGGQIKFPATQVPAADANTLDDYEEGTWVPVIGGSGGTSGQAYSTQIGHYLKIGKNVHITFNVVLSTRGTITTTAQIQGLPFTIETGTTPALCITHWAALGVSYTTLGGYGTAATTTANISGFPSSGVAGTLGTSATLAQADFSNTTQLVGCMTYRASA